MHEFPNKPWSAWKICHKVYKYESPPKYIRILLKPYAPHLEDVHWQIHHTGN